MPRVLSKGNLSLLSAEPQTLNEYEIQRQKNIQENEALLAMLDIGKTRATLSAVAALNPGDSNRGGVGDALDAKKKRKAAVPVLRNVDANIKKRAKIVVDKFARRPVVRTRMSTRLRAGSTLTDVPTVGVGDTVENELAIESIEQLDDPDDPGAYLVDPDDYFDDAVKAKAVRVDGHYNGWVNPALMEKYGFEENAADAWEKNGGGTFSFKDPLGTGQKVKKVNAKLMAQKLFKKNPNAYFYRHAEPDEPQWGGDWTDEERQLFMEVAAEHGCGDKWGLFSTFIPHRVGYQCSAYYRQVLAQGLIFDSNYRISRSGAAVYVGSRGRARS